LTAEVRSEPLSVLQYLNKNDTFLLCVLTFAVIFLVCQKSPGRFVTNEVFALFQALNDFLNESSLELLLLSSLQQREYYARGALLANSGIRG
jgi:esterase/lipase superfamily enzyme